MSGAFELEKNYQFSDIENEGIIDDVFDDV